RARRARPLRPQRPARAVRQGWIHHHQRTGRADQPMNAVNVVAAIAGFLAVPILLAIARALGIFVVVRERQCVVFELFGTVRLALDRPGLHSPWLRLGPVAALLPLFGRRRVVDQRLDQTYLRSEPVNSEEGAP